MAANNLYAVMSFVRCRLNKRETKETIFAPLMCHFWQ